MPTVQGPPRRLATRTEGGHTWDAGSLSGIQDPEATALVLALRLLLWLLRAGGQQEG